MTTVLFICTGNAARSVMAGAILASHAPHVRVETAGTLVVEGQPMSWRTRAAIQALDIEPPNHRSQQATSRHIDRADVVIALAPEHVEWVRRTHPSASERTATLKRLVDQLPEGSAALPARIKQLGLANADLGEWEEVVDPGGGEADVFAACGREIDELVRALITRL